MDISKSIMTESAPPPDLLKDYEKVKNASEKGKIEFAQKFEALFVNKLLDEMTKTIGEWGMEKDAASGQIHGMFNMLLSQEITKKGGLGLSKDIYNYISGLEQKDATAQSLDKTI